MPQPLTQFPGREMTMLDGHNIKDSVCEKYPLLAAKAMGVIASFSKTEALQLDLYLTILNTPDDSSVASAYLSLDYGSKKRELVDSIAKARLCEKDVWYYEIIARAVKSSQKKREALAHGYWGYNEGVKDALILADPKFAIGAIHQLSKASTPTGKMRVYKAKDFDAITKENYELAQGIMLLTAIVKSQRNGSATNALYAKLEALPVIQDKKDRPA